MDKSQVEALVKEAIAEITGVEPQKITLDQHLVDDLKMESIDIVDFSYELEKRTDLDLNLFDFFQVTQMRSEENFYDPCVKDVIQFVLEKSKQK
jgi:acyl carrier protein